MDARVDPPLERHGCSTVRVPWFGRWEACQTRRQARSARLATLFPLPVVCCLLSVVCCPLPAARCPLPAARCFPRTLFLLRFRLFVPGNFWPPSTGKLAASHTASPHVSVRLATKAIAAIAANAGSARRWHPETPGVARCVQPVSSARAGEPGRGPGTVHRRRAIKA